MERENKQDRVPTNETAVKSDEVVKPIVRNTKYGAKDTKNTMFITFDATKDLNGQKTKIDKQIDAQLKNYDGNGKLTVNKVMTVQDFSRTEQTVLHNEQSARIISLMNHVSYEVGNRTNAALISTNDEIKIAHPEQRQAGETKDVLVNDNKKQTDGMANSKAKIKQNIIEIKQIKHGRSR